jgi:predicted metal-dependent peptidase
MKEALGRAGQSSYSVTGAPHCSKAAAVARRMNRGFGKDGLDGVREFEGAINPSLSWREILWQFMVNTPFDFGGFDRRFIHRKLYLEDVCRGIG